MSNTLKKTYSELIEDAINELKENDDIFVSCCEELDSWNGFLGDNKAYQMYELDELHCDMKISEFISRLTSDFNIDDDFFYYSIYGLESFSGSLADHYRDEVDEGELLDNLIDKFNHIDINWINSDFNELLENIVNYSDEE